MSKKNKNSTPKADKTEGEATTDISKAPVAASPDADALEHAVNEKPVLSESANADASASDEPELSADDLPDEIDSTPEGSKKKGKKYKLKTWAQCKEAGLDYGLIAPADPGEEGIDKKEKKKREKEFAKFKERVIHDIELDKKRGPIRWKAAAAIPFVFVSFVLIGWILGDSMAEEAIRSAMIEGFGPSTHVEMDDVSFSIFGPKLSVENLRVYQPTKSLYFNAEDPDFDLLAEQMEGLSEDYAHDDWSEILAMGTLNVDVDFWPLLSGHFYGNLDLRDALVQPDNINPMDAPKPGTPPSAGGSGGAGGAAGAGGTGTGTGAAEEAPEDSEVDSLNEIMDEFEKWRNDPWVQRGIEYAKDWRESRDEEGESEAEIRERNLKARSMLPASPAYIMEAMAGNMRPNFLLREIKAGQMDVKFGRSTHKHKLGESKDEGVLTVRNVSSDPVLWGEFISAEGKLGSALTAEVNYSKKAEDQGKPSKIHVALSDGLLDGVFGKGLTEARAGLLLFEEPRQLSGGMTSTDVFNLSGNVSGGSFDASLWIPRRGGFGALGFAMRDVPLDEIAKGLGDLPFGFTPGMTGTITTCTPDGKGVYSADDPSSCFVVGKDGVSVTLSLKFSGGGLTPKAGQSVLGIPGEDFCEFFNAWLLRQGEAEFRFQLDTNADGSPFKLLYPGDRWLVDSLIDSASITGAKLSQWGGSSIKFAADGNVALRSVDLASKNRLSDSGEPLSDDNADRMSDSLGSLRARAVMKELRVEEFFGSPVNTTLPEARVYVKFFEADGAFAPEVDGGMRGLADAVLTSMDASSETLSGWMNFGMSFAKGGEVDLTSIDLMGQPRTWDSDGAERNDMNNMRASADLKGLVVTNFFGVSTNTTLPDMLIGLRVLDEKGKFSPSLESGSRRPIVLALASNLEWKLSDLTGKNELLGLKFNDDMRVGLIPLEEEKTPGVPAASGPGLANLTFNVVLKNADVDASKQKNALLANRWNTYMEKCEGKIPARVIMFDQKESFSPKFEVDEDRLISDMGDMLELSPKDLADMLPDWAKRNGLDKLLTEGNLPGSTEEARKQAEELAAKKLEEERKKAEEKLAAEKKKREEEIAEAKRVAEEKARKEAEEIKRKAEEELKRKEAEELARKIKEEAERKRKEAEKKLKKYNPFG